MLLFHMMGKYFLNLLILHLAFKNKFLKLLVPHKHILFQDLLSPNDLGWSVCSSVEHKLKNFSFICSDGIVFVGSKMASWCLSRSVA